MSLLVASVASVAQVAQVAIDPRVEMVCAALMQSDWPEGHNGFLSPYAREMQQTFFTFRKDPFVLKLNSLKGKMTVAELLVKALSVGPPLSPSLRNPPSDRFAPPGRPAAGDPLGAELAAFGEETRFGEFFTKHQRYYNELTASYSALLPPGNQPEMLEKYFGSPPAEYLRIIAPVLKGRSTMFGFVGPTGRRVLGNIVPPSGLVDGKLVFDPNAVRDSISYLYGYLLIGEEMSDESAPPIKHADWWPLVREKMEAQSIPSWQRAVAATIAHAVTVRLWQLSDSPADALRHKRESMSEGFALLPFFQERLAEYEASRDKYRTFRAFLPRLLAVMDDLEPILSGTGEPADLGLADVWLTDAGVPVKSVAPGSLAAKAGILKGDTIQSIAGIRINGSESYLKAWKRWEASKNGEVVPFKIVRNGKLLTVDVSMRRKFTFGGFRKRHSP